MCVQSSSSHAAHVHNMLMSQLILIAAEIHNKWIKFAYKFYFYISFLVSLFLWLFFMDGISQVDGNVAAQMCVE